MSRLTYSVLAGAIIAYAILLLAVAALPTCNAYLDRLDAGDPLAVLVAIGLACGAVLLGSRR